ncbi:MAG: TrkA C-terminal domain-containing protein [Clostridia bacterium]|nr:TrkA C-terminal domain-containing protein [Clostridia bacterium]MBQ2190896.1 TrkA C-terminal domain-containing protein [Clostridia bacterium]MBQ5488498.1 TrkA C-terminal domain-containing protein [Clostridia bacterium]
MNIYAAATLFALLILIYWVISELFTMIFRFIGLPEDKARFQVTSLLTGAGFTTRESEMLLTTQRRRRLARITMLFGYVFNITVVSAFINVFLSLKASQVGGYIAGILIPLVTVAVLIIVTRIPAVKAWIENLVRKVAGRLSNDKSVNTVMLIDHIGRGCIAQVALVNVPAELDGVPLFRSGLKEEKGILVMLVEDRTGKIEAPHRDTVFTSGDKLTVFGDYADICRTFDAKEHFA